MQIPLSYQWQALHKLNQIHAQNGPWSDWMMYKQAFKVHQLQQIPAFHGLHCLNSHINLEPLPHQTNTAIQVIEQMHGRAILGDEVGLGKTIEAGLILKEYIIRKQVRKTLILVPASLVLQWVRELTTKFGIQAVAHKKHYVWEAADIVIASIESAKKEPHASTILQQKYDMVIVDEAHKLKNPKTKNYQFVNAIYKKYCLLLTATPLQNDQKELIHLLQLLKPGICNPQSTKQPEQFKQQLNRVLIRNRRDEHLQTESQSKRIIHNIPLTLSAEEFDLYKSVEDFIFASSHTLSHKALSLITLQREVCSSRDAVFITLVNLFKKLPEHAPERAIIWGLVEKIRCIQANSKAEHALKIIQSVPDKLLIFTEYRATQQYLIHFLQQHDIQAVPYQGGMGRGKKDWMTDIFRDKAKVLVATEAGCEGINLQFCNQLINYDLPWNPMRIEQRIGRIHRLGQKRDVHIYNLITTNTIEEHVIELLHTKIGIFEQLIGNLDPILRMNEKQVQKEIFTRFAN